MDQISCPNCLKVYSSQGNLNRHREEVHSLNRVRIEHEIDLYKSKCLEGCNISFVNLSQLREHLYHVHDIPSFVYEETFKNYDEFVAWLNEEETRSQYIKQNGPKRSLNDSELMYYNCRRSGSAPTIKETRKRRMKSQGSCKMNSHCTSQIILSRNIETDVCEVKYYMGHYGHDMNVHHLKLSKPIKDNIASKLILGMPKSEILDEIKKNASPDRAKRSDIITRRDLTNIEASLNLIGKDEDKAKVEDIKRLDIVTRRDLDNIDASQNFIDRDEVEEGEGEEEVEEEEEGQQEEDVEEEEEIEEEEEVEEEEIKEEEDEEEEEEESNKKSDLINELEVRALNLIENVKSNDYSIEQLELMVHLIKEAEDFSTF